MANIEIKRDNDCRLYEVSYVKDNGERSEMVKVSFDFLGSFLEEIVSHHMERVNQNNVDLNKLRSKQ